MSTATKDPFTEEIDFLEKDCLKLIDETFSLCPTQNPDQFPDAFRVVTTPFLYAVWERCFRTSFGVMLRLTLHRFKLPHQMTHRQISLWLQKEPFFNSFIDTIRTKSISQNINGASNGDLRGSAYEKLVTFIDAYTSWRDAPLNTSTDTTDLVMTFSNVNKKVFELNAVSIGLNTFKDYPEFISKIGRLDDLVGRRNDISHGTLAMPPGNKEFIALTQLVKDTLVQEYCDLVRNWISEQL